MVLRKNELPVLDTKKPWDGDVLERQKFAKVLTNAISTIDQPYTISIEAPYGGGKTFFLKRWQQQLSNEGYKAVYYNAWKSDMVDNPFWPFFGCLKDQLSLSKKNKLNNAAKKLAGSIVLNAMENISLGLVKKEDAKHFAEDLNSILDKQLEFQQNVENFRAVLKECSETEKKNIIIFIDELDRCRPNYAIEFLELIKHFFDIPRFVFILGIDRNHLVSSAQAMFGDNLDGDSYLEKFIDYSFRLPAPSTQSYAFNLYDRFGIKDILKSDNNWLNGGDDLIDHFSKICNFFGLSLRAQEQLFSKLNFIIRSFFGEGKLLINPLLCLLLVLREKNYSLYRTFCTKFGNDQVVIDYLEKMDGGSDFLREYNYLYYAMVILGASESPKYIETIVKSFPDSTARHLATKEAQTYYSTIEQRFNISGSVIKYLYQRIEMLYQKEQ